LNARARATTHTHAPRTKQGRGCVTPTSPTFTPPRNRAFSLGIFQALEHEPKKWGVKMLEKACWFSPPSLPTPHDGRLCRAYLHPHAAASPPHAHTQACTRECNNRVSSWLQAGVYAYPSFCAGKKLPATKTPQENNARLYGEGTRASRVLPHHGGHARVVRGVHRVHRGRPGGVRHRAHCPARGVEAAVGGVHIALKRALGWRLPPALNRL
jgi:hypothetical protein